METNIKTYTYLEAPDHRCHSAPGSPRHHPLQRGKDTKDSHEQQRGALSGRAETHTCLPRSGAGSTDVVLTCPWYCLFVYKYMI